jgi:probable F420-dependent oxidoreductase
MKYGVILPNVGTMAYIESLMQIAQRAEGLGYNGVFLSDHIAIPTELRSAYPYRSDGRFPLTASDRILEPVTTLSYLAAVTRRLHLGFSVLVLPYRHPVLNAKMLGTLDVISNGRLIVGAGVGWMEEEFAALNSDFHARGAVTDEHIKMLRAFWTETAPDCKGNHYSVAGLGMAPQPVAQPHPPIWTGGNSPPALRRAANLADGWHGVRQSPDDVARVAGHIGELRAAAGSETEGFTISLRAGLDVTDEPFDGGGRTPLRGSPEQVAGDLAEYERAGLDYLVVEPRAATPEQLIDQLECFITVERP